MSHRVTFKSKMTDKELCKTALETTKHTFDERGDVLTITSGALTRATINTKTGVIESDSDWHRQEQLGVLRQAYSEAQFRQAAFRKGASIQGRSVITHNGVEGVIHLQCSAATL